MNRLPIVLLGLAFSTLAGTYAWVRLRAEIPGAEPPNVAIEAELDKHLVTREMADASREMSGRVAPAFRSPASDGRTYELADLLKEGPVVLTFIKKGCPCSEGAQPFFDTIHAAYPAASFLGVIDVEAEAARSWASRFGATYPLLFDRAGEIVREYGVTNSACVVLIDPRGRIARHWPGYSAPMLRELGADLAEMTGAAEVGLDVIDAPDELFTGCPYGL